MRILLKTFVLCSLLISSVASAESIVLVHGSLANVLTWINRGVLPTLQTLGWQDQGVAYYSINGPSLDTRPTETQSDKMIFRVLLPGEAPLETQAEFLGKELEKIYAYAPDQKLIIVAHSTGGVVSRLALVNGAEKSGVTQLITIASPHLGTPRAADALAITDIPDPLRTMAGIAADVSGVPEYHSLQRSGYLLRQLLNYPGSILNWLNAQKHPDIQYTSIIRTNDSIVPVPSQDMNNIPVLKGKSKVIYSPGDHALYPADAVIVNNLVSHSEK
ncbi:MAG: esterase/lipase family protein [bacterium]